MGKSEKISRAKKDKINNLRKKYDDFLEDDKRRRDRNVYILERLERMRSCVATLQINQKGIALSPEKSLSENPTYTINSPIINNNRIIMRRDVMNYRENTWDNNSILKEISKKYILIPKIHTITPTSSVTYPNVDFENNASDWRNKYNILEQLKRNEKGEPPEKDVPFSPILQDSNISYTTEKDVTDYVLQQDSNVLDKREFFNMKDNYANETHIRSKSPSDKNVNKNKLTNNYDKEKPQIHSSTVKEESDIPIATKELATVKTNSSELSNKKNISSIINNESKTSSGINDFPDNKNNEKGSRVATEEENVVIFNHERDKQEAGKEKEHLDNWVNLKERNSKISIENKQGTIDDEIRKENIVAIEPSIINNEYNQDHQIEDINELNTNFVPNTEDCNENEMQINELEAKPDEIIYADDMKQVIEDNVGYEQSEVYASDNNYTNDQYNYYEQQGAHTEPYTNITHENNEATANYDENHDQQYANAYGNEYTNQYENQTFDNNYETPNNYEQNPNLEYQEPDRQETTEYMNSENYIQPEPTTKTNLSDNPEQYEQYAGEAHSQQELNQHENVEQGQYEIQQQINDEDNYVENQENNVTGEVGQDNAGTENEMFADQHEYVPQTYEENQQQHHVNAKDNYERNEENNVNSYIGEDNIKMNHDIQDMQQDIAQNHNENQQQLLVEGGYGESQNLSNN